MSASWKSKLYHLVLWIVALVYFFPVLWIILSAFKTKNELLATPPKWIFSPTLANFANLLARETFWPTLVNSLLISFLSVSIAIVFSFLAAYSLSRFKPVGTDFIMFLILSIRMVPAAAVVVPVYLMYAALGLERFILAHDVVLRDVQHPFFSLDFEGIHGRGLDAF